MRGVGPCRNICIQFKREREYHKVNGRMIRLSEYALGFKRCQNCEIFIEYDGPLCPCCNTHLRASPRSHAYHRDLVMEARQIVRY